MAKEMSFVPNPPIDYAEVMDRIGGDVAFLKDLLQIYFSEYEEKRNHLEEALVRGDFKALQELGHSLKGSSANLSLHALQKSALALEVAGKELKDEAARLAVASLDSEVKRLKAFLEEHPLP